uniref:Uncharacterized protein n=1 Tax=Arundo donax TaxID=35708 RepID=A0A0A9FSR3_ARUDO
MYSFFSFMCMLCHVIYSNLRLSPQRHERKRKEVSVPKQYYARKNYY